MITTNPRYWDCECEHDYIREKSVSPEPCRRCGAEQYGQPDSRNAEVEKAFPDRTYCGQYQDHDFHGGSTPHRRDPCYMCGVTRAESLLRDLRSVYSELWPAADPDGEIALHGEIEDEIDRITADLP